MEPITIIAIVGGAALFALITIALWNFIAHFLQRTLIPLVRRVLGARVGDLFADFAAFLDAKACPAHELLVRAWAAFKHHVLGVRVQYDKTGPNTVRATTETLLRRTDGKVTKQTTVEDIPWSDVPEDIREHMMRTAQTTAQVDGKDVIEKRAQERAEQEHLTLDLET